MVVGGLIGVKNKFIDSKDTILSDTFYKIIGKNTTAIICVGYRWDGVRSVYVISSNEPGSSAKVSIIIEATGSDGYYKGNFYKDSEGNIYIKGRGNSFTAQLISLTGAVYLEKSSKTESELTPLTNSTVS